MAPDLPAPAPSGPGHTSVLFVCLGNICRSPLAEGVFQHLVQEGGVARRYRIDSAGTGAWHVGEPADPRAREVAARNGIRLSGRARQVQEEDFHEFDLILAMDRDNLRNLQSLRPGTGDSAELRLFREFDPAAGRELEVPDPYYGGPEGFDSVFDMVMRSCRTLLADLEGGGVDGNGGRAGGSGDPEGTEGGGG